MGDPRKNVYDSIMPVRRAKTDFPVSLYATPNPLHQELFYTVLRAGHVRAGSGYGVARDRFHGYEFIYCLSGQARVRVAGLWHEVAPGGLVVFNCHHPHEHLTGATDPWEAYWIRVEGPGLERLGAVLAIERHPVIEAVDPTQLKPVYEEIFALLRGREAQSAPLLHAAVARVVALACCARQLPGWDGAAPPVLRPAVDHMRLNYFEAHRVEDLAARAGISAPHFNRLFRRAYGTSPIDWLRRERINHAKRRLTETADPIEWIAEQVGYRDRFFFSKDFKRMTGLSPREFRRRES
jgi:AraC-like DNA-binding protein